MEVTPASDRSPRRPTAALWGAGRHRGPEPPRGGEDLVQEQVIRFFPYRRARVAYAVTGTGPPLLLDVGRVHHLEAFWQYAPYRWLVQRLSRRFTVFRWDRPGFGMSDRLRPDLS